MGWVVTNNIEKVFDRLISNYWHLLDELYVITDNGQGTEGAREAKEGDGAMQKCSDRDQLNKKSSI